MKCGTALTAFRGEWPTLQRRGVRLRRHLESGGRLLAAGNGGSAAEAQHLTAELVGRFLLERRPFSAICLSAETSSLTAIVNDYGAEEMFARQVQAHGRPVTYCCCCRRPVAAPTCYAAERAREVGMVTWAMTGPGRIRDASGVTNRSPSQAPSTAAIQAVHLVAVHGLCAVVDAADRILAPPVRLGRSPRGGRAAPSWTRADRITCRPGRRHAAPHACRRGRRRGAGSGDRRAYRAHLPGRAGTGA